MKKQRNKTRSRIGTVKFMQSVSKDVWDSLSLLSNKRGITVQEYLRAIIIPNHLESLPIPIKKYSKRAKKAWATRRKNNAFKSDTPPPEPWEVRKEPLPSDQSG